MILLGAAGTKSYLDVSLPASAAGAASVTYQIVALRSTIGGPPAQFTVKFGTGGTGSGALRASIVPAARLAA